MRKFPLIALVIALFTILLANHWPAFSAGAAIESDGTVSLATGTHQIFLDGSTGKNQYAHVIIWTLSGSDTIYITFNNATATTSNASLVAGAGLAYGLGSPAGHSTNQLNYDDASSGTGTLCWLAW